jgi:hypothetical protein
VEGLKNVWTVEAILGNYTFFFTTSMRNDSNPRFGLEDDTPMFIIRYGEQIVERLKRGGYVEGRSRVTFFPFLLFPLLWLRRENYKKKQ